MRSLLSGLFSGLLLGALAPVDLAFGVNCGQTVNTHSAGETNCSAYYEDHTVDRIKNDGGSAGLVCILVEEPSNIAEINYWNQCESLNTNQEVAYTVQVRRSTHGTPSTFKTDTYIGGGSCGKEHSHASFTSCE